MQTNLTMQKKPIKSKRLWVLPLLAGFILVAGYMSALGDDAGNPVVTGARSILPDSTNTVGLNDLLVVQVDNLSNLVAQAAQEHRQIVLYLDGFALPGLYPESVDTLRNELRFQLQRTDSTRQAWATLLGSPKHFVRAISVSVGLENEYPVATEVQGSNRINLIVIHQGWSCVCIIFLVLCVVWFWCLGKDSQLLRDPGPDPGPGNLRPYSLAKTQMAVWSVVILVSFLSIWAITGAYDTVTNSALVLMGIGAGTALAVIVQDKGKEGQSNIGGKSKQMNDLANDQTQTPDVKAAGIAKLKQDIQDLAPVTQSFLPDILTDADGISLHRLQLAIWTLVLVIIFIKEVYCNLAMPEFGGTLLALMGISSGTYIGFMIPEDHSSEE
jgi:hypothetical protein